MAADILTVLGSAKHLILMSPSHSHTRWQVQIQQNVWILSALACPPPPTPVGVGQALTNNKFHYRLTLAFNHQISHTLLARLSLSTSYTPRRENSSYHLSKWDSIWVVVRTHQKIIIKCTSKWCWRNNPRTWPSWRWAQQLFSYTILYFIVVTFLYW